MNEPLRASRSLEEEDISEWERVRLEAMKFLTRPGGPLEPEKLPDSGPQSGN